MWGCLVVPWPCMATRTIRLRPGTDIATTLRWTSVRAAAFERPHGSRRQARGVPGWWWTARTPVGPVTLHIVACAENGVEVTAWGEGADWGLDAAPGLLGCDDDPSSFRPQPGLVAELHRRNPGLRLGKTGLVFDTLLPTIIGQKVTGLEAERSYQSLVRMYGQPAPGPVESWIAPAPETLARLTYADLHPHGIERKRADVVLEAARRHRRLQEAAAMTPAAALARLTALRGIGRWTAAIVLGIALGDPDAVPVGDYHIPNTVAHALAGEPRGSNERMLELLEPYRGHRRRVIVLLKGGGFSAPRYGPKLAPRSIANH